MKIFEYRIILPTHVSKYGIANRYMCARYTRESASDGEGIEIIKNKPYGENGQETYQIFHLKSRLPAAIRWVLPNRYCHAHEICISCYPLVRTEYKLPGMGDDLLCTIDSNHESYNPSKGVSDNLLKLSTEELKERQVVYLDILNGDPKPQPEEDLHDFTCPEAEINESLYAPNEEKDWNRPPEWTKHYKGEMMVCVKVVKFKFRWIGVQTAVETAAMNIGFPKSFCDTNRLLIRWAKEWYDMTWEDILKYEIDVADKQKGVVYDQ
jgi:hypothetical protein